MSSESVFSNTIPCGGENNSSDGCQEIFPRSKGELCQKCKKLNAPGLSDKDKADILKVSSSDPLAIDISEALPIPVYFLFRLWTMWT
jgi:hypothetical protein